MNLAVKIMSLVGLLSLLLVGQFGATRASEREALSETPSEQLAWSIDTTLKALESDKQQTDSTTTLQPHQPVLPSDDLPRWTHRRVVDAKKVEKNQQNFNGFANSVLLPKPLSFIAFQIAFAATNYSISQGFQTKPLPYYRRGPPSRT